MNLDLERKYFYPDRTIGGLYVAGTFRFFTLEDFDRHLEDGIEKKVPKETAIPRGRYRVILDWSQRFQKAMPHVLDVPQFEGIRFHIGNYPGDTEGCILIGKSYDPQAKMILESRKGFDEFFHFLESALMADQEIWLTVT